MTKTETLRRLRVLAAAARAHAGLPRNCRTEIGLRYMQQTATTREEALTRRYPHGDDLADFLTLTEAAKHPTIQTDGSIVHLYLYLREWDLEDTYTGWTGTSNQPPALLDANGTPI